MWPRPIRYNTLHDGIRERFHGGGTGRGPAGVCLRGGGYSRGRECRGDPESEGHCHLQREGSVLRPRRRVPSYGGVALGRACRGWLRALPVAPLALPAGRWRMGGQPARQDWLVSGSRGRQRDPARTALMRSGEMLQPRFLVPASILGIGCLFLPLAQSQPVSSASKYRLEPVADTKLLME